MFKLPANNFVHSVVEPRILLIKIDPGYQRKLQAARAEIPRTVRPGDSLTQRLLELRLKYHRDILRARCGCVLE